MSPRILVADDDAGIRDVVTYALKHEGFELDAVANGVDALETAIATLEARIGDALAWNLLLCDVGIRPAANGGPEAPVTDARGTIDARTGRRNRRRR